MFETIVLLTNAFIANIPLDKVFLALLYVITLYNAKIPLNYVIFVVLFKVNAFRFHLKIKIKAIFSTRRQLGFV